MATSIIGLHGPAQSGKDTVGDYLVEHHGFVRLAFADPLKEAALALDPLVPDGASGFHLPLSRLVDLVGWEEAKKNTEVRRLLQRLGTEVGRELMSPDPTKSVWIALAEAEMAKHERVVFTDARFADEAEFIRRHEGVVVRLCGRGGLSDANATHASEVGLDRSLVDAAIHNDGTLDHLYAQAERLARLFLDYGRPASSTTEEVVDLSKQGGPRGDDAA